MRLLLSGILVALGLLASGAAADEAESIQSVISDQIAAFRADDVDTAFSYASPKIKGLFGSAERFGEMVRSGYPMVWRPADVRFSAIREREGRWVQSVLVTDKAGVLHVLDYEMIRDDAGWRINGVWIRKDTGTGA